MTASSRPNAAAQRRLMAAERTRLESLTRPAPPLAEEFEAVLRRFTPRTVSQERWEAGMGDFVRDVMRRSHVRGAATFPQLLSELSLYVGWAVERGTPMTMPGLLCHHRIEQWVAHGRAEGGPDTTWGNRRSRLRNLASHVMPGPNAPRRAEPIGRASIKAPYTRREMAELVRLSCNQPTRLQARHLHLMLGTGAGAGLSSSDLRYLKPEHVRVDASGRWWIDVPGDNPRSVPVRAAYVEHLRLGIEGVPTGKLLTGVKESRRNITSPLVANAAVGHNTPPDQARLRATWLLAAMTTPVPLADLLAAAGLSGARTLADLLPYATDADYVHPDVLAAMDAVEW
jgi:hypothetical protein